MPKGKPHPAELKARVALEVMHGEKTVSEVASEHDLSPCVSSRGIEQENHLFLSSVSTVLSMRF